jgi:hypothetical protein
VRGLSARGFATWSPEPGAELEALQAVPAGTQAVFISAEMASRLPRSRPTRRWRRVLLGGDRAARGGRERTRLAERVRSQLGLSDEPANEQKHCWPLSGYRAGSLHRS